MGRYFILLVAINNYPSGISKLNGCINDIDRLEEFLIRSYGNTVSEEIIEESSPDGSFKVKISGRLHIVRLVDSQATYHNIVKAFREFLRQAGKNDTVFFHYSGHGAEQFTAQELLKIEPTGKDQVLVCYQTPNTDEPLYLADKEMAILLDEVNRLDTNGEAKESPHIVLSMDCCHSGTITRLDYEEVPEVKTRQIRDRLPLSRALAKSEEIRQLDSYLDGYYLKQKNKGGNYKIPLAPHVLLSACKSDEKANELPIGGMFSHGLLEILEHTGGRISYADLFIKARSVIRNLGMKNRLRKLQTPQFDAFDGFNPHEMFLSGGAAQVFSRGALAEKVNSVYSRTYEILFENGNWYVKCGAIHGIPVNLKTPIGLDIITEEKDIVNQGRIIRTGAQRSQIIIEGNDEYLADKPHFALIKHFAAAPEYVALSGQQSGLDALQEIWDHSLDATPATEPAEIEAANIGVNATEGKIRLNNLTWQRNVFEGRLTPEVLPIVTDSINKMIRWNRVLKLENEHSKIKDWFSVEMGIMLGDREKKFYTGPEVHFHLSEKNAIAHRGNLLMGFSPQLTIHHREQELYIYAFLLRMDYSIACEEGAIPFKPDDSPDQSPIKIPLFKGDKAWGLAVEDNESEIYLKIMVTTEAMDHFQLEQGGIKKIVSEEDGYRTLNFEDGPMGMSDEWWSETIKIRLTRQMTEIRSGVEALLTSSMTLKSLDGLTAKVGLSTAIRHQENGNPTDRFTELERPGFQLIELGDETSQTREQILELTEVNLATGKERLEIILNQKIEAGQLITPVMFNGTDFQVAGITHYEENCVIIEVSDFPKLPSSSDHNTHIDNPFERNDQQHISLYQSVKIGFFIGGKDDIPKAALGIE